MKKFILLKISIFCLLLNTSFLAFANQSKIAAIPVANFTSATITGINTTITLTDASTNAPTSWAWSFSPATVTYQNSTTAASQNPQVNFTASGTYSVTLTATNADGSHAVTNKVYVVGTATVPYTGTFAGSVVTQPYIFPPTGWAVVNPDAPAEGWEAVIVTSIANEPREVARMDNLNYNAKGQLDDLVLPMMDLSGLTNPQLTFNVAHAAYNNLNAERLYIQCSTDGGVTFTTTTYDKSYPNLSTAADQISGWAPAGTADWRIEVVSLLAFKSSNTIIKFVQEAGYGNGLFIHDVKVTDAGALPVELTSFKGEHINQVNHLSWQTASEQSNNGFEIERSADGENWENIAFVQGNGTTTEVSNYEFTDEINRVGFENQHGLYYRLRQIDFDGKYEYSNIINITSTRNEQLLIRVFPNPVNDILNIEIEEPTFIQITNANGQIVKEQKVNSTSTIFVKDLPNGIYFLKTGNTTKKIVIQH